MRILSVVALAMGLLVSSVAPAAAQQDDPQAATAAAQRLLDLAVQGDFNTLFDYLHPDALEQIPRSVGLAIFEGVYGQTEPGPARIEDVRFGDYTWPVNGKTYPNAAEVSYSQDFTNQQGQRATLRSTMYLVPVDGEYRWFLGNSRAFVAEAVARFAPPAPDQQPVDIASLLELIVNDLDGFFQRTFQGTGVNYVTPGVVVVEEGRFATTACGPAQPGFWAFYCPADQTVYLDEPFLNDLAQRYGDFAVAYVIGHEWAHHVQTVTGVERVQEPTRVNEVYSIELELQADCLTGVWSRDMDTRAFLDLRDLAEASTFVFERLGDPDAVGPFDPQAHGSGDQRLDAYSDGYDGGFRGCEIGGLSPVRGQ